VFTCVVVANAFSLGNFLTGIAVSYPAGSNSKLRTAAIGKNQRRGCNKAVGVLLNSFVAFGLAKEN
jgi:hypothetical protein